MITLALAVAYDCEPDEPTWYNPTIVSLTKWFDRVMCIPTLRNVAIGGNENYAWRNIAWTQIKNSAPTSNVVSLSLWHNLSNDHSSIDFLDLICWPKDLERFHLELSIHDFVHHPIAASPFLIIETLKVQQNSLGEIYITIKTINPHTIHSYVGNLRCFTAVKRLALLLNWFRRNEVSILNLESINAVHGLMPIQDMLPSAMKSLCINLNYLKREDLGSDSISELFT